LFTSDLNDPESRRDLLVDCAKGRLASVSGRPMNACDTRLDASNETTRLTARGKVAIGDAANPS
jgi:hypothetical protein